MHLVCLHGCFYQQLAARTAKILDYNMSWILCCWSLIIKNIHDLYCYLFICNTCKFIFFPDYDTLFEYLNTLQGNLETKKLLIADIMKEAARFKKRTLIGLIEQFQKSLIKIEAKKQRIQNANRSSPMGRWYLITWSWSCDMKCPMILQDYLWCGGSCMLGSFCNCYFSLFHGNFIRKWESLRKGCLLKKWNIQVQTCGKCELLYGS